MTQLTEAAAAAAAVQLDFISRSLSTDASLSPFTMSDTSH